MFLQLIDLNRPLTLSLSSIETDGKIRVWSTLPILDEEIEENEANPRLLCTMTQHDGPLSFQFSLKPSPLLISPSLLWGIAFFNKARCCVLGGHIMGGSWLLGLTIKS